MSSTTNTSSDPQAMGPLSAHEEGTGVGTSHHPSPPAGGSPDSIGESRGGGRGVRGMRPVPAGYSQRTMNAPPPTGAPLGTLSTEAGDECPQNRIAGGLELDSDDGRRAVRSGRKEGDVPVPRANAAAAVRSGDWDEARRVADELRAESASSRGNNDDRSGETEDVQDGIGETTEDHNENTNEFEEQDEPSDQADEEVRIPEGYRPHRVDDRREPIARKTSAGLKICSLNINGRGADSIYSQDHKWHQVQAMMRNERINVLGLQETHLSPEMINELRETYKGKLEIFGSIEDGVLNAGGVAFAINSRITNLAGIEVHEIIKGRAIMLILNWHGLHKHAILNTYAPAGRVQEKRRFWNKLTNRMIELKLPSPDTHLGDHNLVEDGVDRLPFGLTGASALAAFIQFKNLHMLVDGWREINPTTKAYTHHNSSDGDARLDRIYVSKEVMKGSHTWAIKSVGSLSDHCMVSYVHTTGNIPYIGKGRWSIPLYVMQDKELMEEVNARGLDLEREIEEKEGVTHPLLLWESFKSDIIARAREKAKRAIPRIDKEIGEWTTRLKTVERDDSLSDDERKLSGALMRAKLTELYDKKAGKSRSTAAAKDYVEGETLSKYWMNVNKVTKPKEIIYRLREPRSDPPQFATRSDKMADLARDYHEDLQNQGNPCNSAEQEEAIEDVLGHIHKRIAAEQKQRLATYLTVEEVRTAIKLAPTNKAAGLDGIPAELWKILDRKAQNKDPDKRTFDVAKVMTVVYNAIEKAGIPKESEFASGWMCPLYKKKSKEEIANYRPITLLNTDYKIMTKTLAIRLADSVPDVIHKDQAGFMRGRSILDQTQLTMLMIEYAEAEEKDGVIVALDQEKAYDKVNHKYLWRVLEAYGYPDHFIGTVKALYEDARTLVVINGEKSSPFQVTRGVRQGDPMSCLLFNLAIEPLAEMLRQSKLEGFHIPGMVERLIASLFADDTTVYLSKNDKFSDLTLILDRWCAASTAKFNVEKTEVIPVGSKLYRQTVVETRRLSPDQDVLPNHIHIAKDGEPVRSLGAWVGNMVAQAGVWSKPIEKSNGRIGWWGRSKPTLDGKRHIIIMHVGQVTQFLTMVQGMPKQVEKELAKIISRALWDGKKAVINVETMQDARDKGGKEILNIQARNKAIDIMWAKRYAVTVDAPSRPAWCFVFDALCRKSLLAEDSRKCGEDSFHNILAQNLGAKRTGIPTTTKRLITAIRENNIRLEAANPSRALKESLPIWHHAYIPTHTRPRYNDGKCKCLRKIHKVRTVGDALKRANEVLEFPEHKAKQGCKCRRCEEWKRQGCPHPHECAKAAKGLLDKIPAKWDPRIAGVYSYCLTDEEKNQNDEAHLTRGKVIFDPEIPQEKTFGEAVRIFDRPATQETPPLQDNPLADPTNEYMTVFVMESEIQALEIIPSAKTEDKHRGAGIWCDARPGWCKETKPLLSPRNAALLTAIIRMLRDADEETNVEIVIANFGIVNALTKQLAKNEKQGWRNVEIPNRDLMITLVALMRTRPGRTAWRVGAKNEPGMVEAKAIADRAARRREPTNKGIMIHPREVRGMQLEPLTQKGAYNAIRPRPKEAIRAPTIPQLKKVRRAQRNRGMRAPTDGEVWKGLAAPEFRRTTKQFLFKTMHNAHKCGKYWGHMKDEELRRRKVCEECSVPGHQVVESIYHILFECKAPARAKIWEEVKRLCELKDIPWETPRMGVLLSCALRRFMNEERVDHAKTRIYRILISEGAYAIWLARNERVIQYQGRRTMCPGGEVAVKRFRAVLRKRRQIDRELTNAKIFKSRALPRELVDSTWDRIDVGVPDEAPNSQIQRSRPEFLVGTTDLGVG